MAQFISPEKKEAILSSVKDEGMGIVNAAKKYGISEKTIRKWLHKQTKNDHTSAAEVEKLKRDNQALKIMLADVALSQQLKRKIPLIIT
jgi:transposase-like protein